MIFQAEKTVNRLLARFFCLWALLWASCLSVPGVFAQTTSTDRNRPIVMTGNQIMGAQHGEGGDTYYQFYGGPGEIILTADGKTDFYAATMEVNCMDIRGNRVARLSFAATSAMTAATTKFNLNSAQPVLIQVRFYKDDKVKNFVYRITLTNSVVQRQRPDRRANTRNGATYWSVNRDEMSPEQEEVDEMRYQAESSREAEIQRIAQLRASNEARRQQYSQRNYSQQAVLQQKAEQARAARASRNTKAINTAPPVIPVYQPAQTSQTYQAPQTYPAPQAYQAPQTYQAPVQMQPPPQQVAVIAPISKPVQTQQVIIQDSTSTPVEETPIDDKWALVVGVSKFENSGIDLKYPAKDAKDFRDYLINEANFRPDHVKLLVNEEATKERVLTELGDKWLPKRAHPNDLVVVYLSTHGSPSSLDGEGVNYLVMHNTDPQRLYATGLAVQDLAFALKSRVHAKRSVLIMDACHSGAADAAKGLKRDGNVNLEAFPIGTGQMVICSSKPDQVSWESKRYDNGVFTAQLLKALRTNSKNSLGDAFKTMQDNVESEVLKDRGHVQTPVLKTRWQGRELILTIPPAKPHSDSEQ
jgi:hypothetical protein